MSYTIYSGKRLTVDHGKHDLQYVATPNSFTVSHIYRCKNCNREFLSFIIENNSCKWEVSESISTPKYSHEEYDQPFYYETYIKSTIKEMLSFIKKHPTWDFSLSFLQGKGIPSASALQEIKFHKLVDDSSGKCIIDKANVKTYFQKLTSNC